MFGLGDFADKVKGTTDALVIALGKISDAIEKLVEINSAKQYETFRNQLLEAKSSELDFDLCIILKEPNPLSSHSNTSYEKLTSGGKLNLINRPRNYVIKGETKIQIDPFGICFSVLAGNNRNISFLFEDIFSIQIHFLDKD